MRSSIILSSLALVGFASGCASAARSSQAACAPPEVDSSGWQRVGQGAATLLIPANLEERPAESARERRFVRNDQVVVVGSTPATNAQHIPSIGATNDPMADRTPVGRCTARIAGREVSVLSFQDRNGYHAEALWRHATGDSDLHVRVAARSRSDYERLRAAIWTVTLPGG